MPISAKWKHKSSIHIGFIVFNGGVTTFFAKSVYTIKHQNFSKVKNLKVDRWALSLTGPWLGSGNGFLPVWCHAIK